MSDSQYLVVVYVVTAGLHGDDLGSDEEEMLIFAWLVLDIKHSEVIAVESRLVKPRARSLSQDEESYTRISDYAHTTFGITDELIKSQGLPLEAIIDELDQFVKNICPSDSGQLFTLITDGQNHLRQVIHPQTAQCNLTLPSYYYSFYDLRKEFCKFYHVPTSMLNGINVVNIPGGVHTSEMLHGQSHLTSNQLSILANSTASSSTSSIVSSSEQLTINTHDHHIHHRHNSTVSISDGIESPPIVSPLPSGSDVSLDSGNCSRHSLSPATTFTGGTGNGKTSSISSTSSSGSTGSNCMLNSPLSSSSSPPTFSLVSGGTSRKSKEDDSAMTSLQNTSPHKQQQQQQQQQQTVMSNSFYCAATPIDAMLNHLSIEADISSDVVISRVQNIAKVIMRMINDGHTFTVREDIRDRLHPGLCKRSDAIDGNTIVRARGLPWQSSDQDIAKFFRGLNIGKGGVALCLSPQGRRNGEALIRFDTQEHRDMALKRHRHHIGPRYIEVYRASGEDFLAVAAGYTASAAGATADVNASLTKSTSTTISNSCDVMHGEDGVLFVKKCDGRPTGDAFVLFESEEIASRALLKHRECIGSRYIELFRSSTAEVQQVLNRTMDNTRTPMTSSMAAFDQHLVHAQQAAAINAIAAAAAAAAHHHQGQSHHISHAHHHTLQGQQGHGQSVPSQQQQQQQQQPPPPPPPPQSQSQPPSVTAAPLISNHLHSQVAALSTATLNPTLISPAALLSHHAAAGMHNGHGTTGTGGQGPPLTGHHVTSSRKDCIRLRGLPYEAQVEQILDFLSEHAKYIVFQGVHMVYNAQGQPSGEAFIQMDSEQSAAQAAIQKHHMYMTFGKKARYIEVFQCSIDDMNLILTGGVPVQRPIIPAGGTLLHPRYPTPYAPAPYLHAVAAAAVMQNVTSNSPPHHPHHPQQHYLQFLTL